METDAMRIAESSGAGIASMEVQHPKTHAGRFVEMDLTLGSGLVMMETSLTWMDAITSAMLSQAGHAVAVLTGLRMYVLRSLGMFIE